MTTRNERQMKAAELRLMRRFGLTGRNRHAFVCWTSNVYKDMELHAECAHSGCSAPTVKRISVNCWGSLYEFDACEVHAKYDGRRVDSF